MWVYFGKVRFRQAGGGKGMRLQMFGCDRRKICHGSVSRTDDSRRIRVCDVGAAWNSDGVMVRGRLVGLLGYEESLVSVPLRQNLITNR